MSTIEEEQLETLPVNHPQAGYLNHDRSGILGTGTVPAEEQAIYDERTAADEAEAEAVAQAENDVATADPDAPPEGKGKSQQPKAKDDPKPATRDS